MTAQLLHTVYINNSINRNMTEWKNETCCKYPKDGGREDKGECCWGVNLAKIYCKHFCNYYNVLQYNSKDT
jgi:hypothetical protein